MFLFRAPALTENIVKVTTAQEMVIIQVFPKQGLPISPIQKIQKVEDVNTLILL